MRMDKETVYYLQITYPGNVVVQDIVYGIWGDEKKLSFGLASHSSTVNVKDKNMNSGNELIFTSDNDIKYDFKIMDAEEYEKLRGVLFSQNAPKIKDDEEVQEFIMSQPRY